jgi:hypothetical protein
MFSLDCIIDMFFCMLQVHTSELCAQYSLPDIIQYFIIYVFIAC